MMVQFLLSRKIDMQMQNDGSITFYFLTMEEILNSSPVGLRMTTER